MSSLREQFDAMAQHVRDPAAHPGPPGIEARRLKIYSDLVYNNLDGLLAGGFPVIKDLMVDRSAFDRIIQAGGYVSVNTGSPVDANATPIQKDNADAAFAAAACIGCGACVAACKNSSAMLFVSAKVSHLALLPQGHPERKSRVTNMIAQMDKEGFGSCTNTGACEAVCPKEIKMSNIARLNNEYLVAGLTIDK